MTEITETMSIDEADAGCRALDEWRRAEARAAARAKAGR